MPITESTPRRLVLASGSTTLTLDKDAGKASLQRKMLFWNLKPTELPLSEFSSVDVGQGGGSRVRCRDFPFHAGHAGRGRLGVSRQMTKPEAEKNIAALREFLALQS